MKKITKSRKKKLAKVRRLQVPFFFSEFKKFIYIGEGEKKSLI